MRCKFCGSKAIYPHKNHQQGSAGRVVAGAIIAGPVGAMVGLAGKNVNGYRCSACGMFSEQAMEFTEELSIDSAIRDARNGKTVIYERYQAKYANLEFIPFQQAANRNAAHLTTSDYDEEHKTDETPIEEQADESIKHSYNPGQFVVGSPVFISNVTIKDDDGTDVLCLEASNISEKTLRSVYLNVTVYDDVGDQISTNTFAYQGLQAAPGESLQQAKPFKLNTNVAYKVDVSCEKAAFADDSVWRKEENPTVYSVADKTELTPESFAQYKYLRALLDKKSTLPSGRTLYYPVAEETHRLCICGTPVISGSKCPVCGLDEDTLGEVMDYDVLRQARKDVIASVAKERMEALQELRELMLKERYQEAEQLLKTKTSKNYKEAAEIFASISGYKDSDEQAKRCFAEAETCSKEENYQEAQNLLGKRTEKDCKKAAEIFASLSGYKDSTEQAEHCLAEAEGFRKDAIYKSAVALMGTNKVTGLQDAIAEFTKIPGWKDTDQNITTCKQRIEELKAKEEADRIERERKAEIGRKEAERKAKKKKLMSIGAGFVACVVVVFVIVLFTVIIPNNNYNKAIALMEEGKYAEAVAIFETLGGHKDSNNKMTECNTAIIDGKYNDAIALMEKGKYAEAVAIFETLGRHKDSINKMHECKTAIIDGKYNNAITLMEAGNIVEAYDTFLALGGYKDSADKAESIYDKYRIEKMKDAKVGDYVFFGAYEQDNNTTNGKEDIEWLVLEVKNGKILVISKYALDCKQYNTSHADVTWATCSLRKWLNSSFINSALSANEKAMIPTVTVSADENPEYGTNPGKATQDKVFLLSIPEADKYFSSYCAAQCKATDYAVSNGAYIFDNGNCDWWLRSPGSYETKAATVFDSGKVDVSGESVDRDVYVVRPAMWIDLSKTS